MLDLIGDDGDYDDGGGDGGDDDDGGLVQIGASKAQRAAAPGATSPNLNSTNATRIIINFFCCNKLCFFRALDCWLNGVKCNGKGLQTKNMKQRRRSSDI